MALVHRPVTDLIRGYFVFVGNLRDLLIRILDQCVIARLFPRALGTRIGARDDVLNVVDEVAVESLVWESRSSLDLSTLRPLTAEVMERDKWPAIDGTLESEGRRDSK